MKASSAVMPGKAFQILKDGNNCTVEFYDNVQSSQAVDGITGQTLPSWDYEKYVLETPYSPSLAAQIEGDYAEWLQKAKEAESAAESEKVRNYRDDLLNTADTKYCNAELWAKMDDGQHAVWTAYKQSLRDVPAQEGFPYAVNWPQIPEGGNI